MHTFTDIHFNLGLSVTCVEREWRRLKWPLKDLHFNKHLSITERWAYYPLMRFSSSQTLSFCELVVWDDSCTKTNEWFKSKPDNETKTFWIATLRPWVQMCREWGIVCWKLTFSGSLLTGHGRGVAYKASISFWWTLVQHYIIVISHFCK